MSSSFNTLLPSQGPNLTLRGKNCVAKTPRPALAILEGLTVNSDGKIH